MKAPEQGDIVVLHRFEVFSHVGNGSWYKRKLLHSEKVVGTVRQVRFTYRGGTRCYVYISGYYGWHRFYHDDEILDSFDIVLSEMGVL